MKKIKITVSATMIVPDRLEVDMKDKSFDHTYKEGRDCRDKALAYYRPVIAFDAHNIPRDLVEQYGDDDDLLWMPKLFANQGTARWECPYGSNPFEITMEEV